MTITGPTPSATYVLPIRRTAAPVDPELTGYLAGIARRCELIIVDGSDPEVFAAAHGQWSGFAAHISPDPDIAGANGKVRGVLTGVGLASQERLVIADDDVRYDDQALERAIRALDDADLVRPQNYFAPSPWHAQWDTARTLLNRAIGADFSGTMLVRRSVLARAGGYDSDVLFENLELVRTVEAVSGRTTSPLDLYVRRLPPSARHFWSQRCRQAYDEFARPWRLTAFLFLAPLAGIAVHQRRRAVLAAAGVTAVALAELGRRRSGGAAVFPVSATVFAPLWLLERSVCSWLALGARARGGVQYGGRRVVTAATPRRVLRARLSGRTHG